MKANTRPMKPTSRSGERTPAGGFAVLLPLGRNREIGRCRDQFAPWRVRARHRRSRRGSCNLCLQLLDREQGRRHDRRRDAAAAGARPFRQVRMADADLDVLRLQVEGLGDRIGDHAARAGADVLHGAACDKAAALDRELDRRAGLPQIEPVARRDADTTPVTAGLRGGRFAVLPDVETGGPVVKPLPVGIGVPALAQLDRVDLHAQRRLVDRLFERKGHRRTAGAAERRAGGRLLSTSKSTSSLASAG